MNVVGCGDVEQHNREIPRKSAGKGEKACSAQIICEFYRFGSRAKSMTA